MPIHPLPYHHMASISLFQDSCIKEYHNTLPSSNPSISQSQNPGLLSSPNHNIKECFLPLCLYELYSYHVSTSSHLLSTLKYNQHHLPLTFYLLLSSYNYSGSLLCILLLSELVDYLLCRKIV